MPEKETVERAREDAREGKSPSTQAGEFVREEFDHVREGQHGARSTKQVIAIGLSKARRAGVNLAAPSTPGVSAKTRKQAQRYLEGQSHSRPTPSPRRSRATFDALKIEGHGAASPQAISKQAHASARKRSATERQRAARKAVRTASLRFLSSFLVVRLSSPQSERASFEQPDRGSGRTSPWNGSPWSPRGGGTKPQS
jgi:hypothetical protein